MSKRNAVIVGSQRDFVELVAKHLGGVAYEDRVVVPHVSYDHTCNSGNGDWVANCNACDEENAFTALIPVIDFPTFADDVRGKVVYGCLPPHLAVLAEKVWVADWSDGGKLVEVK